MCVSVRVCVCVCVCVCPCVCVHVIPCIVCTHRSTCHCTCAAVCHLHTLSQLYPSILPLDGPLLATLEGHRGPVSGVVCMHVPSAAGTEQRGLLLVTCSHDGTLKTWDLASLGVVQTLQGHEGAVLDMAVTEDGRHAVSGGLDGTVR